MVLKSEVNFSVFIPALAWVTVTIHLLGALTIVGYLRSKPPLAKSVMDLANQAVVLSSFLLSFSAAIYITHLTLFQVNSDQALWIKFEIWRAFLYGCHT